MARFRTVVFTLGALIALSACAQRQQEEVVYMEPDPIAGEPAYSKY